MIQNSAISAVKQAIGKIDMHDENTLIISIDKSKNGDCILGLVASNGKQFKFLVTRSPLKSLRHYDDVTKEGDVVYKLRYLCNFYKRFRQIERNNRSFIYWGIYDFTEKMKADIRDNLLREDKTTILIVDDEYVGEIREAISDWTRAMFYQLSPRYYSNEFTHFEIHAWSKKKITDILIIQEGFLHSNLKCHGKIYEDLYKFATITDNLANYYRRWRLDNQEPCKHYKQLL